MATNAPSTGAPTRASAYPYTIADLSRFCAERGLSERRFGRASIGDPRLIGDLRSGRRLRPATAARIARFMAGEKADNHAVPSKAQRVIADDPHPIIGEIARFLVEAGMSETDFGIGALSDPKLVPQLRAGRDPRRVTVARIRSFIASEGSTPCAR